ncbi:hypothetical protein MFRU_006g00400 [Monilinia fructicola]|nr:hypothetical protein MFRU_006g00400 [Monilinia fructicola]
MDHFEKQISMHIVAIHNIQQVNAEFTETNAIPAHFPAWLSEIDDWARSAVDLRQRIVSARAFLFQYEAHLRDATS